MNTSALFQNSTCLSQEVLIRYVKDELSGSEKRAVELHIADCEICFDTVEGLALIQKDRLNVIKQELSNRISKRIAADEKIKIIPIYKRWYSMAAAIAALIIISVYMANVYQHDTGIAQLETQKQTVPIENVPAKISNEALSSAAEQVNPATNSITEQTQQNKVSASQSEVATENIGNSETKFKSTERVANSLPQVAKSFSDTVKRNDDISLADNKVETVTKEVSAIDEVQTTTVLSAPKPVMDMVTSESLKKNISAKKSTGVAEAPSAFSGTSANGAANTFDYAVYDKGVNAFKAGDYAGALIAMQTLLKSQANNTNANFYAGASHYELKNYSQALVNLNVAIQNKQGLLYEDALWFKGNTLLKMNNALCKKWLSKMESTSNKPKRF